MFGGVRIHKALYLKGRLPRNREASLISEAAEEAFFSASQPHKGIRSGRRLRVVYQSKTYVVRNTKSVFTCGGFKVCKYSMLLHTIIFEERLKNGEFPVVRY